MLSYASLSFNLRIRSTHFLQNHFFKPAIQIGVRNGFKHAFLLGTLLNIISSTRGRSSYATKTRAGKMKIHLLEVLRH